MRFYSDSLYKDIFVFPGDAPVWVRRNSNEERTFFYTRRVLPAKNIIIDHMSRSNFESCHCEISREKALEIDKELIDFVEETLSPTMRKRYNYQIHVWYAKDICHKCGFGVCEGHDVLLEAELYDCGREYFDNWCVSGYITHAVLYLDGAVIDKWQGGF